jgi:hypothetical protein
MKLLKTPVQFFNSAGHPYDRSMTNAIEPDNPPLAARFLEQALLFNFIIHAIAMAISAGRSLRTSPPTVRSNLTHHTSPRFIGDISHCAFCPFHRVRLARFVLCHLFVGGIKMLADHMRAHHGLDKLADAPRSNDRVQTIVNTLVDGNGQFLLHEDLSPVYV